VKQTSARGRSEARCSSKYMSPEHGPTTKSDAHHASRFVFRRDFCAFWVCNREKKTFF
jgi:hypothetical protein